MHQSRSQLAGSIKTPAMDKAAVSFTGGKDSMLALHLVAQNISLNTQPEDAAMKALAAAAAQAARAANYGTPAASTAISLLVTFAPYGHDKPGKGFKAHPIPAIRAQARALGIPHIVCELDPSLSPLEAYKQQIGMLNSKYGITQLVTGDILDVADGFMRRAVDGTGVTLVTPLWQQPRQKVLAACFALGVDSIISCINVSKYGNAARNAAAGCHNTGSDAQAGATDGIAGAAAGAWDAVALLLGKQVTPALVAGPLVEAQQLFGADLGGELGDYHTIVYNAPLFLQPVELSVLTVVQSGDYAYVMLDVPPS
jgi:diphthamide synthase (EF-2-diphthine--ammonia ligase)